MKFLLVILLFPMALFSQSSKDYSVLLIAEVNSTAPSITIKWPLQSSNSYVLHRKLKSDNSFGIALKSLLGTDTMYIDTDVEVGKSYEYSLRRNAGAYVAYGYINSGINVPADGLNGKLILLVEMKVDSALSIELDDYTQVIESEGWSVLKMVVKTSESVKDIRSMIIDEYDKDPDNTKAVLIFGNVPVPYSGNLAPDGHSNHVGAWPCDGYYGEMDGSWTDVVINNTAASDVRNKNTPGDGKFDQSTFPSDVELQVGRIDLSDMPAFSMNEYELLRAYLVKNNAYRKKEFSPVYRTVIDDNFGGFGGEAFAGSAWKAFAPMVGVDSIFIDDYFTSTSSKSYIWSYGCGGGSYTSANGIGNTNDFAADSLQAVFTALFGSYFGDWHKTNSFLRAPLAQGLTLTNAWSGRPHWYFHHMALGENIGYSQYLSVNNSPYYIHYGKKFVHIALMGDPTLRMFMVAPPKNLVLTAIGNAVKLDWTASAENVLGYHIYRRDTVADIYIRVNNEIITTTTYSDYLLENSGANYYTVRAVQLQETPSGTYYNLSSGAFGIIEMNYVGIERLSQSDNVNIYPNPSSGLVYINSKEKIKVGSSLSVFDATGRMILSEQITKEQRNNTMSIDFSTYNPGCYYLKLSSQGMGHTEKLIIIR